AEILLNPGSYARIDQNSSFEFATTDLDDLQLKITRGSAIFEVYASKDFYVTVLTPSSRFYLIKSGVYRVDVMPDGASRIEVRKGIARVGSLSAKKLGKGKSVFVSGTSLAQTKFKRSERDAFEAWSRERAKGLAKANARLKRKSVKRSLFGSSAFNQRNTYFGSGVWAFDPRTGFYCYLPFGYSGRSPYGFRLSRNIYYYDLAVRSYYYQQSYSGRRNHDSGSNTYRPVVPNTESGGKTNVGRPGRRKISTTIDGETAPRRKRTPRFSGRRSNPRTTPRRQPGTAPRRVSPPRPRPRRMAPRTPQTAPRSRPVTRTKVSSKRIN
ncbi:MAG: hypothetical protein HKN25_06020, partial [Pyrinomonadaceae bacterium]|nr:hypothetical protein [Pyrinomonadaceae bacterium]